MQLKEMTYQLNILKTCGHLQFEYGAGDEASPILVLITMGCIRIFHHLPQNHLQKNLYSNF